MDINYLYHFIVTLVLVYIAFIFIGAIGSMVVNNPSTKKRIYLFIGCCVITYFILGYREEQEENYKYELDKIIQEYETLVDNAYYNGYYDATETRSISASYRTYGTDFESTWGDLIDANGGELVYDTLTPEQQALVNYPYFNKENVYFVPNGSNYHSVDWCYTLEKSREIINCTLQDALNKKLDPCSKCIGE